MLLSTHNCLLYHKHCDGTQIRQTVKHYLVEIGILWTDDGIGGRS
jgi:agmatine/peptidylarginine deiminase